MVSDMNDWRSEWRHCPTCLVRGDEPASEPIALSYEGCSLADAQAAEQFALAYVCEVGTSKETMVDAVSTLRGQVLQYESHLQRAYEAIRWTLRNCTAETYSPWHTALLSLRAALPEALMEPTPPAPDSLVTQGDEPASTEGTGSVLSWEAMAGAPPAPENRFVVRNIDDSGYFSIYDNQILDDITDVCATPEDAWQAVMIALPAPDSAWIPVSRELPPVHNRWILICSDGKYVFPARYEYGDNDPTWSFGLSGPLTVTHWQPLPQPPTEAEEPND